MVVGDDFIVDLVLICLLLFDFLSELVDFVIFSIEFSGECHDLVIELSDLYLPVQLHCHHLGLQQLRLFS